jgi:hypothetical protein
MHVDLPSEEDAGNILPVGVPEVKPPRDQGSSAQTVVKRQQKSKHGANFEQAREHCSTIAQQYAKK